MGFYGCLHVLHNFNGENGKSDLAEARLHPPVDKFSVVKKQVHAKEVHFWDGIVYSCGRHPHITIVDEGGFVDLNVRKVTSKVLAKEKVEELDLPVQATVKHMKESLIMHKNNVQSKAIHRQRLSKHQGQLLGHQ